jgi:hypothetical protein
MGWAPKSRGMGGGLCPAEAIFYAGKCANCRFPHFSGRNRRSLSHPAAVAPICPISCRSGVLRHPRHHYSDTTGRSTTTTPTPQCVTTTRNTRTPLHIPVRCSGNTRQPRLYTPVEVSLTVQSIINTQHTTHAPAAAVAWRCVHVRVAAPRRRHGRLRQRKRKRGVAGGEPGGVARCARRWVVFVVGFFPSCLFSLSGFSPCSLLSGFSPCYLLSGSLGGGFLVVGFLRWVSGYGGLLVGFLVGGWLAGFSPRGESLGSKGVCRST